ncbi:hypothetical protein Btru_047513 [Bulinus truncatus]|nr:hypothetical protein Btru_047513 [Bulinus truncatus]
MTLSMSSDGLMLNGSRPPSVLSNYKPNPVKQHGYYTVAKKSSVDESLFRSHYSTKLDEAITHSKSPLENRKPRKSQNKEKKDGFKGPPLLWCPPPSSACHVKSNQKLKPDSTDIYLWSTKQHYRQLKYKPTFVDESLFGSKKEEPSFEAPWNESRREKKESNHILFHHPKNGQASEIKHVNHDCSQQPISTSIIDRPIWKP